MLTLFTMFACTPLWADANEIRRWTGVEHFAMPLHDWSQVNDKLVAKPVSFGGAWKGPDEMSWARFYKPGFPIWNCLKPLQAWNVAYGN